MDFHILDIVLYFVIGIILWYSLPKQYRFELGMVMGYCVMGIYTIIYLIIFVAFDFNWIDIFHSININNIKLHL